MALGHPEQEGDAGARLSREVLHGTPQTPRADGAPSSEQRSRLQSVGPLLVCTQPDSVSLPISLLGSPSVYC